MARMIVGSRAQDLAVAQARTVLAELGAEWPDTAFVQRSLPSDEAVLRALEQGALNLGLLELARLPLSLPENVVLAAVTKRLEPRSVLIARGQRGLAELPEGARVGVATRREATFVRAARRDLNPVEGLERLEDGLAHLATDDLQALVVPAALLVQLGRGRGGDALLEPELFPPAVGQGCLGVLVREDDSLAAELAYTVRHRPSFDRVSAERSFARALSGTDYALGALALVSSEGELTLFGALAHEREALSIQGQTTGEASEAVALGSELAQDMLEQLKQRA